MRTNLKLAIGERFRTQVAFARAVDIHPVRISQIVCGWTQPKTDERERMSIALNADAEWLFATPVGISIPARNTDERSR
jgi:hypothetical protein